METIQTLHHTLADRLGGYYTPPEASTLARYLLEEVCGKTYPSLILEGHKVSDFERKHLETLTQRLLRHEPWQQVLGYTEFCGLRLSVTPDVLIPRPETEELCQMIHDRGLLTPESRLLDIGTGSGAIALALATFCPTAKVTALDISSAALAIARQNARDLGVKNITFLHSDLRAYTPTETLDLIVSNPPYVLDSERPTIAPHVLEYEPESALFVPDSDPQLFYRLILEQAAPALRIGGTIALELNHATAKGTEVLYRQAGYQTELVEDFRGLRRFLFAQKADTNL